MAETPTAPERFTVQVTIEAPPERVFEAWTDPDQISRWFVPVDGWSAPLDLISVDARPGGTWRVSMVDEKGEAYPAVFHYREVDKPRRLVFTTGAPDQDPNDPAIQQATLTLTPVDGGTEVTYEGRTSDPDQYEAAGWTAMLDRMRSQLAPG